jgi:hypothetical protein
VVSGPRVFGIPAAKAPVIAVVRRGPSAWSHVGRWDVESGEYRAGAWIRANLYPQRCDLSPDGRWFCYFTLRGRASWAAGTTYVAVSKLPWLHALVAWGTCGTWTRGAHFVEDRGTQELGPPDEGDAEGLALRYGLALTRPATFAVERRRGWHEASETPARDPDDMWDERRADRVVMCKRQPGGGRELRVRGRLAAFREGPFGSRPGAVSYSLADAGDEMVLDDVQWADWDHRGRLLLATADGRLQIRSAGAGRLAAEQEVDLARLRPDPRQAPSEARRW